MSQNYFYRGEIVVLAKWQRLTMGKEGLQAAGNIQYLNLHVNNLPTFTNVYT